MTPQGGDEVRELLARMDGSAEALARQPLAERTAAAGRVVDAWADPGSKERARLLDEHPAASGLSRENLAAGLDLALAEWSGEALAGLALQEIEDAEVRLPGVTAVLHGGVIPMPSLLDALVPLVLGSPVLAKPAASDPVTPQVVAESLAAHAPELAPAFAVADFRRDDRAAFEALLAAQRVLVTGSDEAVAAVREAAAPDTRVVAHGHKLSVALLGVDAELELAAEALAVDATLWDQLGCLSPIACWVAGDLERSRDFAVCLARALDVRELSFPRGSVATEAAARIAHERGDAELRAATRRGVALHVGTTWTVVAETDPAPRDAPLHRFVRVHPLADASELPAALAPVASFVAGLGYEGLAPDVASGVARELGATHTAPFGRLQAPPIGWARDGVGVFTGLLEG